MLTVSDTNRSHIEHPYTKLAKPSLITYIKLCKYSRNEIENVYILTDHLSHCINSLE